MELLFAAWALLSSAAVFLAPIATLIRLVFG